MSISENTATRSYPTGPAQRYPGTPQQHGKEIAMHRDDAARIRSRIAAGEHLTADEWQLLMEHDLFAHQIADLTREYIAALVYRKLIEQRRTREWVTTA
jgi:hypothetical protein